MEVKETTKVLCKHNFYSVTFNIDITYTICTNTTSTKTLMLYLDSWDNALRLLFFHIFIINFISFRKDLEQHHKNNE